MSDDTKTADRSQGEGNREAARAYNEAVHEHVRSGDVEQAARDAADQSAAEAERSEAEGRSRAKELDPETRRDYGSPS